MKPLQYAVYKGTGGKFGALQFNFSAPHYFKGKEKDFTGKDAFELKEGKMVLKEGWELREGGIFVDITSAKDKNVYDWDKKIVMNLSVSDMGKVLLTLTTGNECSLMHDPGAKSEAQGAVKKWLKISAPKGIKEGCIVTATHTAGGETRSHTVPLTGDEVLVLQQLIRTAIAKALNW